MPTEFHFPEYTFTLQLFLKRAQGLIDVIVTNLNVNDGSILQLNGNGDLKGQQRCRDEILL